jgi:hypothetical protein
MKFTQSISELMIFTVVVKSSLKSVVEATYAHVDNGIIKLGVNDDGCLNAASVGLQRWNEELGGWQESTVYGSPAEGWGVWADGFAGRANENYGAITDRIDSFTHDESSATSVVTIGGEKVKVTHHFYPSPRDPNLYEIDVMLENVSGSTITDLRYRRAMDWDVDPTPFNECVKIQPDPATVANLHRATNNGFDRCDFAGELTGTVAPFDFGVPSDHGAVFEFHFGSLPAGQTKEFQLFYGGAGNILDADTALGHVRAETYSYGSPKSSSGSCDLGTNIFIFAFAGVGGPPVVPDPDAGATGDPHMITWSGGKYDFHGVCDLVLASTPALDIQIRTHKMAAWSYVEASSLRIGNDVLEVTGGKENMNKVRFNGVINEIENSNEEVLSISGHPVTFTKISDKSQEFVVHLGDSERITFRTWQSFVSVNVRNPSEENFGSSVGLMGSFPSGEKLARDKTTILNDVNEFGMEWQVTGDEVKLFHETKEPQFPQKCVVPSSIDMRRRLEASEVSVQAAEIVCDGVEAHVKDLCIFDVMATSDKSVAGAY